MANILAGKTADGNAPLGLAIPFTANEEARLYAAATLDTILEGFRSSLTPEQYTALTAKFLAHLSKTGLQSPERISTFPASTLADAIREAPELIASKAGIAAILRGHQRRSSQSAAHLKRNLPDKLPPRVILWERGDYRLEEATDPRHLQQDSAALSHCVGTSHNSSSLKLAGLAETDPEAVHHLHYWQKMKKGETRILTLTRKELPVATIEYDTATRAILQIKGRLDSHIERKSPYLPHLCAALHAVKEGFQLTSIKDLPESSSDNTILTANGTFEPVTESNLSLALAGSVTISKDTSQSFLDAAVSSPRITLVITNAPQHVLDKLISVAGSIRSRATALNLPVLRNSGSICAHRAVTFRIPLLEKSGDIHAEAASTLELSALRSSGNIHSDQAILVKLPLLKKSGDIWANSASALELPALQTSGSIHANLATALNHPTLKHCGFIYAFRATTANLPALQTSGSIRASAASKLDLPALLASGDIDADIASTVNCPALRSSGNICAPAASTLNLPALKRHGSIHTSESATLILPARPFQPIER